MNTFNERHDDWIAQTRPLIKVEDVALGKMLNEYTDKDVERMRIQIFNDQFEKVRCECGWEGIYRELIKGYVGVGYGPYADVEGVSRCPQCKSYIGWDIIRTTTGRCPRCRELVEAELFEDRYICSMCSTDVEIP